MNYYNEIDLYAAAWLRNLIAGGHIAPGVVDTRSIEDVNPAELDGYTQCHFFAGIGIWSHALRRAGWPDDRPVWTGSCPCQPFSEAGKSGGFADERHLWPAWFHLIQTKRPGVVFGEQVEAAVRHGWLDLVQADLEGAGYTVGAVSFPAAGVGAPHIRQRLWFVGDAFGQRLEGHAGDGDGQQNGAVAPRSVAETGDTGGLADSAGQRQYGRGPSQAGDGRDTARVESQRLCDVGGLADAEHDGIISDTACEAHRPGPTNGFWRDADWLGCRDGKWRPVESGTFPLAHGAAQRVGRLRAYGNGIVSEAAVALIQSYMQDNP